MVNWTSSQQEAINFSGANMLLSAGAGAGKTAVLIERILQKILRENEPQEIDRLLVVTYTNAAAAQMKERLSREIFEAFQKYPENFHLKRQILLMQQAHVSTLHSFCLDLVREYFYLIDLDPKVRIGQDAELAILREKVLDKIFEDYYANEKSSLKILLNNYNKNVYDDKIRKLIIDSVNKSYSMPNPKNWIKDLVNPYINQDISIYSDFLKEIVLVDLKKIAHASAGALDIVTNEDFGLEKYEKTFYYEVEFFKTAVEICEKDLFECINYLKTLENISLLAITKKDDHDPEMKKKVQDIRKGYKAEMKKILDTYGTGKNILEQEMADLTPFASAFSEILIAYIDAWQAEKKRKNIMDFADLEHMTLEILENESVREFVQNKFDEVLVDEYQDVNEVQEKILSLVANGKNRVMVGDIKQSIYRFRMAEPSLFMEKFVNYGANIDGKRVDLNANFRSQAGIIEGTNFIFRQLLTGGVTEITYDSSASLEPANKSYPEKPINVAILPLKNSPETATADEDFNEDEAQVTESVVQVLNAAEKEAYYIGRKIQKLIVDDEYSYNDIVILLHSRGAWGEQFKASLEAQSIPIIYGSGENIFNSPEVQIITALLQILDNPYQDIPLVAVLHSPIADFSLKELAELKIAGGEGKYFDFLHNNTSKKAKDFIALYEELQKFARIATLPELIARIYELTSFDLIVGAMKDGRDRVKNLEKFRQESLNYSRDNYKGLNRFLTYVERMKTTAINKNTAAETKENKVRIMTIHSSKGLEFPVVFVAGCGRRFNFDDQRGDLLLHRKLGLGMKNVLREKRVKYPAISHRAVVQKVEWETLAEEMRLLYVAMTRAEKELFLVGTVKDREFLQKLALDIKKLDGEAIAPNILRARPNYINWIFMSIIRHDDVIFAADLPKIPAKNSKFNLEIFENFNEEIIEKSKDDFNIFPENFDLEVGENPLVAAFSYQYPHALATQTPAKFSVTGLQEKAKIEANQKIKKITPMNEKASDKYALAGTFIHKCFEEIDYKTANAEIRAKIEMKFANFDAPDEVKKIINIDSIINFVEGEVGEKLRDADEILREVPFVMKHNIAGIDDDIVVQGVIDLIFIKDNKINIVDYKTGHSATLSDAEILQKYGTQLNLYRRAVREILGREVEACFLYFTGEGRMVFA